MNRRLLTLLSVTALVIFCLVQTRAGAQQYTTVPGQFGGRPSCSPAIASTGNQYTCIARAANNALFGFTYDLFRGLRGPIGMPAVTVRNPSCTDEHERTDTFEDKYDFATTCAAVGPDNGLVAFVIYNSVIDGLLPSTAINLGGNLAGDPSCVLIASGTSVMDTAATCVAVDTNNRLVAIYFNWARGYVSPWQVLGGTVVDNPSCVAAKGGLDQVICAVKGTDNSLFAIRFAPQNGFSTGPAYSSGFKSLGGQFVGSPSCANTGSGTVTCAARNASNALQGIRFNMTTKSAIQNLGGTWVGDPSCAAALQGLNRVICAGRATDNSLESIRFDPSTGFRSGFLAIPGRFASDPSCAHTRNPNADYGVFCAARAMTNTIALFYTSP